MMMLRLSPPLACEGYEPKISKLVMRIRGRLAVDVGASLGQYTIPFASHFERVISVEPSPINLPILRQHLKRLKLENVRIAAMVNPAASIFVLISPHEYPSRT